MATLIKPTLARIAQCTPDIITPQFTGHETGNLANVMQIDFRLPNGYSRQGMEVLAQECAEDLADSGIKAWPITEGFGDGLVHVSTQSVVALAGNSGTFEGYSKHYEPIGETKCLY